MHLAQFYQTIIPKLLGQSEFEIMFIILQHPHFSFKSRAELKRYVCTTLQIPPGNIKQYWQVRWQKIDLLICTDVYAKFPLRPAKKILLKHGAGVLTRILRRHPFRKTIYDFDINVLNGNYDLELIKRFSPNGTLNSELICLGFPYLDRLKSNVTSRKSYFKNLGLDANQKTILFAPSWRRLKHMQEEQNFLSEIVKALNNENVNILIKLHACSFNKAMVDGMDWKQKLQPFAKSINVAVDFQVDDIPALQHSEVLITDVSSRAFNFMLLEKPVILFTSAEAMSDDLDKERIDFMKQGAFTATDPSDVKKILGQLNQSSTMKTKRTDVAKHCFVNYGSATDEFVKLVKKEMQIIS